MHAVTLDDLASDAAADAIDDAAAATADVDVFCSSSAWALAAAGTLSPAPAPWLRAGDAGYVLAQRLTHPDGFPYLAPLEMMWGLQSPIVGADPVALVEASVGALAADPDWAVALWPGLSATGPHLPALARLVPRGWAVRLGPPTIRHVAALAGGVDGFLARRSPNLRRSLRRAARDAALAGVTFEALAPADADATFARLVAVEERSWKAAEDVGLRPGLFREFYQRMARRLAARGRLRAVFARQGDADVAYCLGAVFAGGYRGLQFSYDDAHAALSLGGLCQLRQIEALAEEPAPVRSYDLGTEMAYKRRWAEGEHTTRLVVIQR